MTRAPPRRPRSRRAAGKAANPTADGRTRPARDDVGAAPRRTPARANGKIQTGRAARTPHRRRASRVWSVVRLYLRAPGFVQLGLAVALVVLLAPAVNWVYQVAKKPAELFFPVSGRLYKTPAETWHAYGPLFRTHSTPIMTPELLAGLAQTEASGNPVARTYWRWRAARDPREWYKPASSAVGMYQLTDGTFEEARRWCIRDHRVVADGPWYAWNSCWFNALYTRVLPSHAVELAASHLDRHVRRILARSGRRAASLEQQQDLAIVTHLCGAGAATRFAAAGLRPTPEQRCGDHAVADYLERVHGYARVFERLARRP